MLLSLLSGLLVVFRLVVAITIVKTCTFKYNAPNFVSLTTRPLDFETFHHCFEHISDEVMYHVLDNVKDVKKIYFLTYKYVYYSCSLGKMY